MVAMAGLAAALPLLFAQTDPVTASASNRLYEMHDREIGAVVAVEDGAFRGLTVTDRLRRTKLVLAEPFEVLLQDGRIYRASDFAIDPAGVSVTQLSGQEDASRLVERLRGNRIEAPLTTHDGGIHAAWSVELREGSHYVRQTVTLTAMDPRTWRRLPPAISC